MTHITSRSELLTLHADICHDALEIMKGKNADYGADTDGLRNFRLCEQMMIPITTGIITRLGDKLARVAKIVATGETVVKDETVQDTIKDAINYLVILAAALNEKKLNTPKPLGESVPPGGIPRVSGITIIGASDAKV